MPLTQFNPVNLICIVEIFSSSSTKYALLLEVVKNPLVTGPQVKKIQA